MNESDSVREFFANLLTRHDDLLAVVATDKDGVVLAKAGAPEFDDTLLPGLAAMSTFALATQQAEKFNLGECKTASTFFERYQLVHVVHCPLIVTLVAQEKANNDTLTGLAPLLQQKLEGVRLFMLREGNNE